MTSKAEANLNDLLARYLNANGPIYIHGTIVKANFGPTTDVDISARYEGCDTCGHGASEDTEITFEVEYTTSDGETNYRTINEDPLEFLAKMLKWEDEIGESNDSK